MKIKRVTVSLLLLLGAVCCGAEQKLEPEFKIRGGNHGNWWLLGQTVNFRALSNAAAKDLTAYRNTLASGEEPGKVILPDDWNSITGTVFDSDERNLGETTVSAAEFARDGWCWEPSEPGFYSVVFSVNDKSGGTLSLYEDITSITGWTVKVPEITVPRLKHQFAVLSNRPRPSAERSCFGVNLGWGATPEELRIVPLIGFDFVRLQAINWYQIEKSKGVFNWSMMDNIVNRLHDVGIRNIVGSVWGTPKWASSHPDAPGKGIWQDYSAAYAPANMSDLSDFLTVLVKRYPEIRTWEAWNEPHFPGQSIFWRSSPEEYVALQKTSYETIKALQPDSTVWLGGIGMRYLPFYREIMELGIGKYFDVLPLHGRDTNPEPFWAINRRYNFDPKPWVQGEWHAILFKTAENEPATETELSRRMLLDLMVDFQRQVGKIVVWGWRQGVDREFYQHLHDHGEKRVSIGGFFRREPYCEPRLPLVVLCNFMDCFSGDITFAGSYAFGDGTQQAVLLESSAGNVLFFWQNGDTPVKPASELATAVTAESTLLTWEGRTLKFGDAFRLQPGRIYFLRTPGMNTITDWKKHRSADILQEDTAVLNTEVYGHYREGRIFGPDMKVVDPETLVWHSIERYVPIEPNVLRPIGEGKNRASGLAGRFALGFSEGGMDLLVEVNDGVHVQNYPTENLWEGDSLQFALDAVGKGRPDDRIEFVAALTDKGPLLWKHFAPMLVGDLPARYTDPPAEVKYGRIEIDKPPGMLIYKIHISRDDIYPLAHQASQPVRFSLLLNNNDGKGRAGYLEWASGIGYGKHPWDYGTMTIDVGNRQILSQQDLKTFSGQGQADFGQTTAKVTVSVPAQGEMLRAGRFPVIPGVAYRLSFAARGSLSIRAFAGLVDGSGEVTRLDLITRYALSPDKWTEFEHTFVIPLEMKEMYLTVYSWQEQGFFEVKDFSLTTGAFSPGE